MQDEGHPQASIALHSVTEGTLRGFSRPISLSLGEMPEPNIRGVPNYDIDGERLDSQKIRIDRAICRKHAIAD